MRKVILTVDLESDWETKQTNAIEEILPSFLDFLKKNNAKATFFTVGDIAKKFPEQIKLIKKYNHEIASHSLTHSNLKQITITQLEKEVSESKKILEKLGCKVEGFRAPLGVAPKQLIPLLKKYNYTYNSSVFASWFPGRYNNLSKSNPKKYNNGIIELPIPNVSVLKVPAGLSYLKLFHPILNKSFAKDPYMIYLHLHEFNKNKISKNIPAHVRLAYSRNRGAKAWKIFKQYINNSNANFITCRDFIKSQSSL
ncbi:polysaccharide deacetylase family protein [Candidatus Woesearchaeota archaeon]|jgi:peptidoglycan/xylan/chitin deacetylase (PgdA/CDA1 family)|nr:polysaccharide deacetylase family protein [Candidatus Woesearchaeota archaeon]MBT7402810.1 polysaccharide deacetylase family protein [Candidatus Woesearchaeota archaeon]